MGKARVPLECGDARSSANGRRIRGGREEGERGSEGGTRGKTGTYRKNPTLFYFTRTTSDALHSPLTISRLPPRIFPLSAAFPVAVSSPFALYLARAASLFPSFSSLSFLLSSYQIESLYFASSIISFINLRAFRTL